MIPARLRLMAVAVAFASCFAPPLKARSDGAASEIVTLGFVAARALPARTVIGPNDLRRSKTEVPGTVRHPEEAIGKETRVTIYAGRPIYAGDLAPRALVERNDLVRIRFSSGALSIVAEGRSLDRGSVGDRVRVMNTSSRVVISGSVTDTGEIEVNR